MGTGLVSADDTPGQLPVGQGWRCSAAECGHQLESKDKNAPESTSAADQQDPQPAPAAATSGIQALQAPPQAQTHTAQAAAMQGSQIFSLCRPGSTGDSIPVSWLTQRGLHVPALPSQPPVHIQAARAKGPRPILLSPRSSSGQLPRLPSLQAKDSRDAQAVMEPETARAHPTTPPAYSPVGFATAQQHHASPNVQKQRTACLAAMLSPPPRLPTPAIYCPSAAALILGVRLCIATAHHGTRNGKVVDLQPALGKHRVHFDDGSSEWLCVGQSSWRWLSPRMPSAGLTPALRRALRKLGASNMVHAEAQAPLPAPTQGPPIPALGPTPADAAAAVKHHLWLWSPGDGRWHSALVLALSSAGSGRHHLVYLDGSDEWVELNKELVAWEPQSTKAQQLALGMPAGTPAPSGQAAVGWRIGVYWAQDQTFYEGQIVSYKVSTGQHEVLYDDEEREVMRLEREVVVWRCKTSLSGSRGKEAVPKRPSSRNSKGSAAKRPRSTPVDAGLLQPRNTSSSSPSLDGSPAVIDAAPSCSTVRMQAMQHQLGAASMLGVELAQVQACKATAGQQVHGVNRMMQQVV